MIHVAVIGAGQWGRNHVRALSRLPGTRLTWVVDPDATRLEAAGLVAPDARLRLDLSEVLCDERLDAVVIASPAPTHGPVARAALAAGKHVFVEKPLTPMAAEAWDLVRRARRVDRLLGVGHLLLHHPAVRMLKRVSQRKTFGPIRYIHCTRTNYGRLRPEEGALVSLAPHDLSVMVHLLGCWPTGVAARGARHVQPHFEDVVFLSLRFPGGVMGQVHLSWLEPLKVRRISVVGAGAMAVFDDMAPTDKLRVIPAPRGGGARGAARAPQVPRLPDREPLREELKAFLRSVRTGEALLTPGEDGARVARVLEAAQRSLDAGGREIRLRIR